MSFATAQRRILPDAETLAQAVAAWLEDMVKFSAPPFRVALSGGSTPKRLYEILAKRADFPWDRVHWYWGDERFVPADDKDSNFRMVREAMLDKAPIPAGNIHPVPVESETAAIAAERYAACLKLHYEADQLDPARPFFDIVLLGIGDDAHTASLFPGSKALNEKERLVVDVTDGTPPTRITLTYPTLNSARFVAFLVSGKKKQEAISRIMRDDQTAPAAHIKPVGQTYLFADQDALPADFA